MEKCIEGAKWLINYQVECKQICSIGRPFIEFQKVYSWTNEFIPGYLDLINFNDKNSALAVMASGDHSFNLVTNGIMNIDTFDTNRLTEFYALGFKRAMILKYDYQSFLTKMLYISSDLVTIEYISDLILELLPYMDSTHAKYWKSIVDYTFKLQKEQGTNLNLIQMLTLNNNLTDITNYNNYLTNEEQYELLRKRLTQANINFKYANAANLSREFTGKYDLMLLSNILDYFAKLWSFNWGYEKLQAYEKDLESLMNRDGVIFLKYIYHYGANDKIIRRHALICDSSITRKNLTEEEVCRLAPDPKTKAFNGMILKKVR